MNDEYRVPLTTLDGPMEGETQRLNRIDWKMWYGYAPDTAAQLDNACCEPDGEPTLSDRPDTIWIGHYSFDRDEEALVWNPAPAYAEWANYERTSGEYRSPGVKWEPAAVEAAGESPVEGWLYLRATGGPLDGDYLRLPHVTWVRWAVMLGDGVGSFAHAPGRVVDMDTAPEPGLLLGYYQFDRDTEALAWRGLP